MEQRGGGSRVVVAIGGNAISPPARPGADQRSVVLSAMEQVADLLGDGHEVVLTHGNGPQVGDLVAQNEIAFGVVPQAPLDVCVAQTQASIGLMLAVALEEVLGRRGMHRSAVTILTRVRVSRRDPAWTSPTKPIGSFLDPGQNRRLVDSGVTTVAVGTSRWRRVVASPEPLEVVDIQAVKTLLAAGFVPIVAGGGGIPGVREDEVWHGVEAVLDKDLTGALLARSLEAQCLVLATDVPNVIVDYGRPEARSLHRVTPSELRRYASSGHFPVGSMGPKVEAAARFVEGSGGSAIITSLARIRAAVDGDAGTVVEDDGRAA